MEKRLTDSAAHNPQRTEATEMGWTGSETSCAIRCPCDRDLQQSFDKDIEHHTSVWKVPKAAAIWGGAQDTIRDPMRQQLGGWEGYQDVYTLGHSSYVF